MKISINNNYNFIYIALLILGTTYNISNNKNINFGPKFNFNKLNFGPKLRNRNIQYDNDGQSQEDSDAQATSLLHSELNPNHLSITMPKEDTSDENNLFLEEKATPLPHSELVPSRNNQKTKDEIEQLKIHISITLLEFQPISLSLFQKLHEIFNKLNNLSILEDNEVLKNNLIKFNATVQCMSQMINNKIQFIYFLVYNQINSIDHTIKPMNTIMGSILRYEQNSKIPNWIQMDIDKIFEQFIVLEQQPNYQYLIMTLSKIKSYELISQPFEEGVKIPKKPLKIGISSVDLNIPIIFEYIQKLGDNIYKILNVKNQFTIYLILSMYVSEILDTNHNVLLFFFDQEYKKALVTFNLDIELDLKSKYILKDNSIYINMLYNIHLFAKLYTPLFEAIFEGQEIDIENIDFFLVDSDDKILTLL